MAIFGKNTLRGKVTQISCHIVAGNAHFSTWIVTEYLQKAVQEISCVGGVVITNSNMCQGLIDRRVSSKNRLSHFHIAQMMIHDYDVLKTPVLY